MKKHKRLEMLGIIKEIAGETHLLLNASIEASAAGEFANDSAWLRRGTKASRTDKDICGRDKGIVSEIQVATNAAVLATEQSVKTWIEAWMVQKQDSYRVNF